MDSLHHELTLEIPDTSRAKLLMTLAENENEEEVWMNYNSQALALAEEKIPTAKGQSLLLFLKVKANSLANKGYYWDYHEQIQKSLDFYYAAIDIYKQIDDQAGLATALSNMAIIYSDQNDYKEAKDLLHESLKIRRKLKTPGQIGITLINLGVIAEEEGDTIKAQELYEEAGWLTLQAKNWTFYATAMNNLGGIHYKKGEYRKAIEYMKIATENYLKTEDYDGVAMSYSNISSNLLRLGEVDSALIYAKKSYDISSGLGHPDLSELTTKNMYLSYKLKGSYKKSLQFLEEHLIYKDCLNNFQVQKAALKKKQNYDKKVDSLDHIKELEKQDAINQAKDEKRQQQITFIALGSGLLVIFTGFIFQRLRVTRKQKKIIEIQKEEVDHQKQLVDEKNKEIIDSISYAKRIQDAILPPIDEFKSNIEAGFILYQPKDIVAGDFYWLEVLKDRILIAAADCTGHGVPGAMVSVICNNGLNRSVREFGLIDPGKILDKTRELVIKEFEKSTDEVKDGMDIALVALQSKKQNENEAPHSPHSFSLSYSGAHNPLWIIRKGAIEIEEIKANKQPIGKFDKPIPYTTHEIQVNKGDSIYIFSDGFADQFGGPKGKKLKSKNFKKLLLDHVHLPMEEQKKVLDQTLESWRGTIEQLDDICVIGVRI